MIKWLANKALKDLEHKHRLQLEKELHTYTLKLNEMENKYRDAITRAKSDAEIKTREAISLAKLKAEQEAAKVQHEAERKYNERVAALNDSNYKKLADALTKLHEEGNNSTRFTQDLALKMLGAIPAIKTETKVISKSED